MLHLSQDDIEYLKPSSEANFIQHPAHYIKSGSEYNSNRNIFYEVDLEPYELKEIENLKQEMTHSGISLNNSWGDRELLKYLYAAKFNVQKAAANLKDSLRWRTEIQLLPITDKTLEVLHSGLIYPFGKDNQSRPVLLFNLDKLDAKTGDRNELSVVINFYLDSLKQHSFLQGKVENLIIVIDAAGKEFNGLPFEKFDSFLKRIISAHPTSVEKVYVLNASSSFKTQGNVVRGFLENDSFDKVQFISSSEYFKLQESIPKAQLENKYGGSAPDVTNFWPVSSITSRKSYVYEAPVQTYERYTSSGVYGNTSYFDFDTTETKKIYERTTMTLPVTDYTFTRVEHEHVVKSAPVHFEEPAPLDDKYDFNDEALLDLVARESRLIGGSKPSTSPLKLTDDLTYKLDRYDTFGPSVTVTNINTNTYGDNQYIESYEVKKIVETSYMYPTSATTPYPVETEKKSAVVYQDTGRNSHVDNWSVKKYLATVEDKEDEPEEKATIEFCGLCVSNRRTQKS